MGCSTKTAITNYKNQLQNPIFLDGKSSITSRVRLVLTENPPCSFLLPTLPFTFHGYLSLEHSPRTNWLEQPSIFFRPVCKIVSMRNPHHSVLNVSRRQCQTSTY